MDTTSCVVAYGPCNTPCSEYENAITTAGSVHKRRTISSRGWIYWWAPSPNP